MGAGHLAERRLYEWAPCESRWQAAWRAAGAFAAPELSEHERGTHIFAAAPFTSGNAHLGHVRSYSIADAYARFKRASGEHVVFAMGFDAFGLPAELAAAGANMQPGPWVEQCAAAMRRQFEQMGFSFAWERTFISSEPDMYRWSQRIFLDLLERGLVYQKEAQVDWCDSCQTVLARSQAEDGHCWRCGEEVALVKRAQWFLRASAYLTECSEQLASLEQWDGNSIGSQQAALGKTDGFELEARTLDGMSLGVFAPSLDQVAETAFVAMPPGHPEIDKWLTTVDEGEQVLGMRTAGWRRAERQAEAAAFVDTTMRVIVPGVAHMVPVLVAPYVEPRFGATAILGVPSEDATAAAIATQLSGDSAPMKVQAPPLNPRPAVRFSAADFPISRQRGWGAPIPIVHCPACGIVPVTQAELPVELPNDLEFVGTGNPLQSSESFVDSACPTCAGDAKRETQTLDCHFDALWIWIPACVPADARAREMLTHAQVERCLPVHQIVWGADGGAYILSQRVAAMMLRDLGVLDYLPDGEPFERALMHGMVKSEGKKMSKHLGNVVDPDELVARVGADTLRLAIAYAAAPKNDVSWAERDIDHCHRFLRRLWRFVIDECQLGGELVDAPSGAGTRERRRLSRWCDTATRKVTRDLQELQMHRAARNVMLLLSRIEDFAAQAGGDGEDMSPQDRAALRAALRVLVQLIAPLTPHIAEELWEALGGAGFVSTEPWPASDAAGQAMDERRADRAVDRTAA